jgi:hypothetical protein
MGDKKMIKIIKTEFATGYQPVRTETTKDMNFFDLTDFTLCEKDFALLFKHEIGEFAEVSSLHDDGAYISIKYDTSNHGILEIYPAKEPEPKGPDKRPTKNLESLIKYANEQGLHVHINQTSLERGATWYACLFNEMSTIKAIPFTTSATPYEAVKAALKEAGLLK